jgi:hypothetical protein
LNFKLTHRRKMRLAELGEATFPKTGFSASSNFPRTPPARMRLWSASAFDQIDGGITLQRVAA